MTTTTLTKTPRTLVASTSLSAGTVTTAPTTNQRQTGTLDLRTAQGGLLTIKITNGGTGPTIQALCNILISHSSSATAPSLPAVGTAVAGADWKTLWSVGGGTTINAITEQSMEVGPGVMWLAVEFTGNTGQAVTVEAYFSEITSAVTV